MIRGRLIGIPGRLRPFVLAHLSLPSHHIAGDINFLVDTGADSTLLAPSDASLLAIDTTRLAQGPPSTGVGGSTPTVQATAVITLDQRNFNIGLRVLAPQTQAQRRALSRIPSLLGRDIISSFALVLEERTGRVLLLDPDEADALNLP